MDTFEILHALGAEIVTNTAQRREPDGKYTVLGQFVGGTMVLTDVALRLAAELAPPPPAPAKRGRPSKLSAGLEGLLDTP